MDENLYLDDLKQLVDYQTQQQYSVLFQVQVLSGAPFSVKVIPLTADGIMPATAQPLLEWRELAPYATWETAGYVRIVTGALQRGVTIFRITPLGMEAVAAW
jgi:hypothetical protein